LRRRARRLCLVVGDLFDDALTLARDLLVAERHAVFAHLHVSPAVALARAHGRDLVKFRVLACHLPALVHLVFVVRLVEGVAEHPARHARRAFAALFDEGDNLSGGQARRISDFDERRLS
jgi:hypothetical protein